MRRVSKFLLPLFVCALAVLSAQAQGPRNVRVDFNETTLKNGLRVITVEDHSAPVVAISITYNVGSRNEHQGRTGFADRLSEPVGEVLHVLAVRVGDVLDLERVARLLLQGVGPCQANARQSQRDRQNASSNHATPPRNSELTGRPFHFPAAEQMHV